MHVHDFVTCKCGAVSVDGGGYYTKVCGNLEDVEDPDYIPHKPRDESLIIGDNNGEEKTKPSS